jgi:hypothetical protein
MDFCGYVKFRKTPDISWLFTVKLVSQEVLCSGARCLISIVCYSISIRFRAGYSRRIISQSCMWLTRWIPLAHMAVETSPLCITFLQRLEGTREKLGVCL